MEENNAISFPKTLRGMYMHRIKNVRTIQNSFHLGSRARHTINVRIYVRTYVVVVVLVVEVGTALVKVYFVRATIECPSLHIVVLHKATAVYTDTGALPQCQSGRAVGADRIEDHQGIG